MQTPHDGHSQVLGWLLQGRQTVYQVRDGRSCWACEIVCRVRKEYAVRADVSDDDGSENVTTLDLFETALL